MVDVLFEQFNDFSIRVSQCCALPMLHVLLTYAFSDNTLVERWL